MNDITKHEWTQEDVYLSVYSDNILLEGSVYKNDAIAIAKHFHDNLSTHERLEFINAIRGVTKLTITSRAQEVGSKHDFGNSVL